MLAGILAVNRLHTIKLISVFQYKVSKLKNIFCKRNEILSLPSREARFPVSWCHRITFLSFEEEAKIGPTEQKAQAVTSPVCPPVRVLKISPVVIVQRIIFPSTEHVARIFSFGSTAQYNTAPSWPYSRRWTKRLSYETLLLSLDEDMPTSFAPAPKKEEIQTLFYSQTRPDLQSDLKKTSLRF